MCSEPVNLMDYHSHDYVMLDDKGDFTDINRVKVTNQLTLSESKGNYVDGPVSMSSLNHSERK